MAIPACFCKSKMIVAGIKIIEAPMIGKKAMKPIIVPHKKGEPNPKKKNPNPPNTP